MKSQERFERISALTTQEAQQLFDDTVTNPAASESEASFALAIAASTGISTAAALNKTDGYTPEFFYKDVPAELRDRLIGYVDGSETDPNNEWPGSHVKNLAFIGASGDPMVVDTFARWDDEGCIAMAPGDVESETIAADWHLKDGQFRPLYFPDSVPLLSAKTTADATTYAGGGEPLACPTCGNQLVTAIHFDGADPAFARFGISGIIHIPVCTFCVPWLHFTDPDDEKWMWVRFSPDGTYTIASAQKYTPSQGEKELPVLHIDDYLTQFGVANPWLNYGPPPYHAMIGGHPIWWQESDYVQCPDCAQLMRNLAQIPASDISPGCGTMDLYVQICLECSVGIVIAQDA
ncbi:hypothetical protein [Corynebacterium mustelae]|uniref:hypothetical protein n=1 Tax=Corynebacterium mustelae TaxID=571915 RepID=UPI000641004D|nr:hypothetical protein [Corynebacterium mustelae]